jgi:hypothetical protein
MRKRRRKRSDDHALGVLALRAFELGDQLRGELDGHTHCALITLASAMAYLVSLYRDEMPPEQRRQHAAALRELAAKIENGLPVGDRVLALVKGGKSCT